MKRMEFTNEEKYRVWLHKLMMNNYIRTVYGSFDCSIGKWVIEWEK